MIKLILADDQDLIRRGLKALLKTAPEIEVIGEAVNGEDCIAQLEKLNPDLILMDIRMPIMDGVAATRAIHSQFPNIKVLVLTTFADREYVQKALQSGAVGYLLKDTPFDELTQAIRLAQKGYVQIAPGLMNYILEVQPAAIARQELTGWHELTARDRQIVELVANGLNNREIGESLFLSEKTVKNRLTNILSCLGLRDRTQLAVNLLRQSVAKSKLSENL
ncbi:response regulator transcription factor [Pseudanabaena sp. FACHB-1277]|jgi:DNA-binding NarL/FixJ family response regulator|uniref:Response regulator transcription factor n=1 Tax=Pseudanabaena cinerea FACHB-1277 TaxID=2949581 RepID=A0A926UWI0_9CYAN|nr:response regulator transcription factor [Pseudanabaena cinerea]MBD2152168.1 response regulator transcription factor [Pseudanabaena cinerea FACHB-1277]